MSYYAKMLERISADPAQKMAYDTEDSTVVIAGPVVENNHSYIENNEVAE